MTESISMSKVESRSVHQRTPYAHKEDASHDENGKVNTIRVIQGSEALLEAIKKEPPRPRSRSMLKLYGILCVAFLCSSMSGFDGSLQGSLLVLKPFQDTFGAGIVGAKAGYITAMYTIGGVCATPFVGPCSDRWGRRFGMFFGCSIVIVGTIIQGTSKQLPQYLAGRFFLGWGNIISSAAAPVYIIEMSHPAYRGRLGGLYNCCYSIGGITASGALRGAVQYNNNLAWLIPVWLQLIWSAVVVLCVWFFPESPRWYYAHGNHEKARNMLAKYHGQGNIHSPFVELQMAEFESEIRENASDKRFWDYRELFNSRASNSVVGYYLPATLATAGITSATTVLSVNLGLGFASFIAALTGASQVDRFGRRSLLFMTCIAMTITWIAVTVSTAIYGETSASGAAIATVFFIFAFNMSYAFGLTPLGPLYPCECLNFEIRAKGFAFNQIVQQISQLANSYVWPIALGNIGWKTYIFFIAWDSFQAIVAWAVLVETKGRTLEELNEVFKSGNPRKASIAIKKVALDESANVTVVEEL